MTDPGCSGVMDLLEGLNAPAGILDGNLRDLANIRMANISLKFGNTHESCHAYTNLGFILGPRFGDYNAAYRYGRLGVDLVNEGACMAMQRGCSRHSPCSWRNG